MRYHCATLARSVKRIITRLNGGRKVSVQDRFDFALPESNGPCRHPAQAASDADVLRIGGPVELPFVPALPFHRERPDQIVRVGCVDPQNGAAICA